MKTTSILLGLTLAVSSVVAVDLATIATNFNIGCSQAFMDDPTDTTNTCYVATYNANINLATALTFSSYTGGVFTTSEFTNDMATFAVKYMTQVNQCRMVEMLEALNTRVNDPVFLYSTGVKLISQAALY